MDPDRRTQSDAALLAVAEAILLEAARRAGVAPPAPGARLPGAERAKIMEALGAMGARPIEFGPAPEWRENC